MHSKRITEIATVVIGLCAVVALVFTLISVCETPVVDSIRWGGDETWLMREFGNQAAHGIMSYPESYNGGTRTDGILAGSMWLNAVIYGVTGNMLHSSYDLASIGRTVTMVLALLLLVLLFQTIRKRTTLFFAVLGVFLTLSCTSFFFASHSARYDMETGLFLLLWVIICERILNGDFFLRQRNICFFGAAAVGLIICSRHLLTLAAPVTLLALCRLGVIRSFRSSATFVAGALTALIVLSVAYYLGAHEISLFGSGGNAGSYDFVLKQIPIFRPFSRNVQVSNIEERLALFVSEAPAILALIFTGLLIFLFARFRNSSDGTTRLSFFTVSAIGVMFSWLLLQGSRPYYLIHVLPLLVCAIIIGIYKSAPPRLEFRGVLWSTVPICIVLTVLHITRMSEAAQVGNHIDHDQRTAIRKIGNVIDSMKPPNSKKPVVLCEVAGLNYALADKHMDARTLDIFQPPAQAEILTRKLHENGIQYVILRSGSHLEALEPGRALLPHVLDSIGNKILSVTGNFYDAGRNYFAPDSSMFDTLTLYQLPEGIAK